MIKQVRNSVTVYDSSWTLRFDNFSEFQNVISDNTPSNAPPPALLWRIEYENRYETHP